jgi:cytochrome c-type biogenesis protein CcmH
MLRIVALLALLLAAPAGAVQPDEVLADPGLESRARTLSRDLRCLVCQNQSIDDSNAPLARDLRVIVRERLSAGDSDRQVLDFVTARYGDYVLLRTPFKASTYLLWLGPLLLLVLGAAAVMLFFARRNRQDTAASAPLTAEESRRLERLLEADGPP